MNKLILSHQDLESQQLLAVRTRLMTDLQALEKLPRHELSQRYYEIQPKLRNVCRELSVSINRCGSETDIT